MSENDTNAIYPILYIKDAPNDVSESDLPFVLGMAGLDPDRFLKQWKYIGQEGHICTFVSRTPWTDHSSTPEIPTDLCVRKNEKEKG